jgi:HlyD family secretion protein
VATLTPVMSSMVDERSAREAAARLKAAAAGVERAAARVERARISLREARLEHERSEKLAGDGFIAPARLDATRLALAAARRDLDMANAEREVAVQEQAQAAAVLQPVGTGARSGRPLPVLSPVSGVVLRVVQASEATVPAGAALLEIGDPSRMEVVSELLTTDAVQAEQGRRVVIERWGGPPVEGRVRRVEPAAFTKVSALGIEEQRVNVLIDITAPPQTWRAMGDGFRVGVRIVTASVEQAVLVPVGALFPHGQGMAVYKLDARRVRLQPVEVAARNGTEAWVRTALTAGDAVVIYPPAALADGRKVRVRAP